MSGKFLYMKIAFWTLNGTSFPSSSMKPRQPLVHSTSSSIFSASIASTVRISGSLPRFCAIASRRKRALVFSRVYSRNSLESLPIMEMNSPVGTRVFGSTISISAGVSHADIVSCLDNLNDMVLLLFTFVLVLQNPALILLVQRGGIQLLKLLGYPAQLLSCSAY